MDYRKVDSGPLLVEAVDQARQSMSIVLKNCVLEKLLLIIKANEMQYFSNLFDKVLYTFREIFRTCPGRPWGPPSLLYNGYRVFPGGEGRLGRKTDPSPPSSAVVKKE